MDHLSIMPCQHLVGVVVIVVVVVVVVVTVILLILLIVIVILIIIVVVGAPPHRGKSLKQFKKQKVLSFVCLET